MLRSSVRTRITFILQTVNFLQISFSLSFFPLNFAGEVVILTEKLNLATLGRYSVFFLLCIFHSFYWLR